MQGRFRHNPAVTVADYMEIIERKTASLFATGARTAAHLAGAPPAVVDAMAACGRDLGLAFQLSDDLLDVAGRPAVTGKPRGIDLRDGNPSLPIVLAMARDPEVARALRQPEPDAAQVEQTLHRIRRSGVLGAIAERARTTSRRRSRRWRASRPRPIAPRSRRWRSGSSTAPPRATPRARTSSSCPARRPSRRTRAHPA